MLKLKINLKPVLAIAISISFWAIPLSFSNGVVQADPPIATLNKIEPELQQSMKLLPPDDLLTVIVRLRTQPNLQGLSGSTNLDRASRQQNVIQGLKNASDVSQRELKILLNRRQVEGRVSDVSYLWIFNGIGLTATPDVILEVAARPEVALVTLNRSIQAPSAPTSQQLSAFAIEPNLSLINVPEMWNLGYKGEGMVIASLDTGVDVNWHSHLASSWRAGTNSWFDPSGQHPNTPFDNNGHGTWTMGVMVGDKHNNSSFGVAPNAKWIAAKIFKDNGSGTALGIHQAFQWILDPDGNPQTADTPHVVNNSWFWFQGCSLEFEADLQALRAAGILPVFAAGNSALTSHSPANNPGAFAVGATDNSDIIWSDSSRGPSACDGTTYPEIVAPGVSIHTTALFGAYFDATGTSIAAPHVTGALALLLQANPNLGVSSQESFLINSVVDLGATGPDNTYGNGRLDILAAYQSMNSLAEQVYLPIILR